MGGGPGGFGGLVGLAGTAAAVTSSANVRQKPTSTPMIPLPFMSSLSRLLDPVAAPRGRRPDDGIPFPPGLKMALFSRSC
jgi:hypothetical protein